MNADPALAAARDHLSGRIRTGEFRPLVERLLVGVGAGLGRLRGGAPVADVLAAAVLVAAVTLFGVCVGALFGELDELREHAWHVGLTVAGTGLTLLAIHRLTNLLFETLLHPILPALRRAADLEDIEQRLCLAFAPRRQVVGVAVLSLVLPLPVAIGLYGDDTPLMMGHLAILTLAGVPAGAALYYAVAVMPLLYRLGKYDFNIFELIPSKSAFIEHLSGVSTQVAYTFGGLALFMTWGGGRAGLLSTTGGTWWLVATTWVPLAVSWIGAQWTFSAIIWSTRRRTLARLQRQMDQLARREDPPSPETLKHLAELLKLHETVQVAPRSAIDLRSALGFANSLLLPVLGFLLSGASDAWPFLRAALFGG